MTAERISLAFLAAFGGLLAAGPATAQTLSFPEPPPAAPPPAFLVLEQERLLTDSAYGREVLAQNREEADALRAEGQSLDRQFEAEERSLTEQRPSLTPEEFRALADAFDAKVVATRREQEEKGVALGQRAEQRRRDFFRRVAPILLEILEASGAAAVVEQRTLLIAKQDLNITDQVIKRLDELYRAEQEGGDAPAPEDPNETTE